MGRDERERAEVFEFTSKNEIYRLQGNRLYLNGQIKKLPLAAAKVLTFLVRHQGEMYSHEAISLAAAQRGVNPAQFVKDRVREIRNLLGSDAIVSEKGWGYGFGLPVRQIDSDTARPLTPQEEAQLQEQCTSAIEERDRTHAALASLRREQEEAQRQIRYLEAELNKSQTERASLQLKLDEILEGTAPVSDSWEGRLRIVLVRHSGKDLFISPHIPFKKAQNSIRTCKVPAHESVIGLIDATVFGSAKDAIVFGRDGMYYHSASRLASVLYSDLPSYTISFDSSEVKLISTAGSGEVVEIRFSLARSDYTVEQLAALLNDLRDVIPRKILSRI